MWWIHCLLMLLQQCPCLLADVDGVSQIDLVLNNGPSARDQFVYNVDQYFPYPFGKGVIR